MNVMSGARLDVQPQGCGAELHLGAPTASWTRLVQFQLLRVAHVSAVVCAGGEGAAFRSAQAGSGGRTSTNRNRSEGLVRRGVGRDVGLARDVLPGCVVGGQRSPWKAAGGRTALESARRSVRHGDRHQMTSAVFVRHERALRIGQAAPGCQTDRVSVAPRREEAPVFPMHGFSSVIEP